MGFVDIDRINEFRKKHPNLRVKQATSKFKNMVRMRVILGKFTTYKKEKIVAKKEDVSWKEKAVHSTFQKKVKR